MFNNFVVQNFVSGTFLVSTLARRVQCSRVRVERGRKSCQMDYTVYKEYRSSCFVMKTPWSMSDSPVTALPSSIAPPWCPQEDSYTYPDWRSNPLAIPSITSASVSFPLHFKLKSSIPFHYTTNKADCGELCDVVKRESTLVPLLVMKTTEIFLSWMQNLAPNWGWFSIEAVLSGHIMAAA